VQTARVQVPPESRTPLSDTAVLEPREADLGRVAPAQGSGVRRFTSAVAIGWAVVTIPYLWVLTDLWSGSPSLFRTVLPDHSLSNFYDLQARAMFSGHLWVPDGSIGVEAFVHAGRQYTYFGLFPSLLRMPVLAFTHSFDGRLTAPSLLLAWLVTGLFSSMLVWRVRWLIRGSAILSRAEATTYGVLVATILGGSVLINLAASPWVYSEDIAWSVALMLGSLFALLGVLESPSWGRVGAAGLLILCATLNRGSAGYGCVLVAALAAVWLGSGRGGTDNRRWWWPILVAGVIPLVIASSVSLVKFGIPYGYPLNDQIDFRKYLSHIKNSYFAVRYLPTTLLAYVAGTGMHVSSVFPFITLPQFPARPVDGVTLFGTQPIATVPGSTPLLFLLTIWGAITVCLRRPAGRTRITAIPLIAAAAPAAAILIFGFVEDRFTGDFLPFLVVGSIIGLVDLWRRLERGSRPVRTVAVALVVVLGAFGIVANTAISLAPTGWWSNAQLVHYVQFQKSAGSLVGQPLSDSVVRGDKLPASAPRGELFILGNCAGLYVYAPNGIRNWVTVEKRTHAASAAPGSGVSLCRSLSSRH
jgi:hypothetical protein